MATRTQSHLQEDLVSLYLRLNGFFVSRFVVHSPAHGRNITELDALAVRLRFNAEPERQVSPDSLLGLGTEYTDLVLCEVKSQRQKLRFNSGLLQDGAIESVLRWAGLFPENIVPSVAEELRQGLSKCRTDEPATAYGPEHTRVRALLFSPERNSRRNNQPWFVTGPELMCFVRQCLSPPAPRERCSTKYDLQAWGKHEVIVRYFKSAVMEGSCDVRSLYDYVQQSGFASLIEPTTGG